MLFLVVWRYVWSLQKFIFLFYDSYFTTLIYSRTLDAVLGQANVIYAKGQVKEALTMLLEVYFLGVLESQRIYRIRDLMKTLPSFTQISVKRSE